MCVLNEVLKTKGLPAPYITSKLRDYGDGSMCNGINNIYTKGLQDGQIQGAVAVTAIVVLAYGLHRVNRFVISKLNKGKTETNGGIENDDN